MSPEGGGRQGKELQSGPCSGKQWQYGWEKTEGENDKLVNKFFKGKISCGIFYFTLIS